MVAGVPDAVPWSFVCGSWQGTVNVVQTVVDFDFDGYFFVDQEGNDLLDGFGREEFRRENEEKLEMSVDFGAMCGGVTYLAAVDGGFDNIEKALHHFILGSSRHLGWN